VLSRRESALTFGVSGAFTSARRQSPPLTRLGDVLIGSHVSPQDPLAAAAAENVKAASQTLETQSKHLGSQVTEFLGRIRAA